jgi:hypothetical protein
VCPPEKTPENLPAGFEGTPSPVLFEGKTCRIAAIFSDSCHNAAKFLCNPGWVAERSGSEPSLPSFTGSAPGTSPARRRFRSWSPPGSGSGNGGSWRWPGGDVGMIEECTAVPRPLSSGKCANLARLACEEVLEWGCYLNQRDSPSDLADLASGQVPAKCLFSTNTLEESGSDLPTNYGLLRDSQFFYWLPYSGSCCDKLRSPDALGLDVANSQTRQSVAALYPRLPSL